MIYLIHYDRSIGKLVDIREFSDTDRDCASEARLALEIELLVSASHDQEVVLLEAPSKEILKNTHSRYFDSLEKMRSKPRE